VSPVSSTRARPRVPRIFVALALALALLPSGCGKASSNSSVSITMPSLTSTAGGAASITEVAPSTTLAVNVASGDEVLAKALAGHESGFEVEGEGTVQRVLSDDLDGARHQRFIVELASGQTILVAHNIDVASRVPGLKAGDRVFFKGEYEWSDKGGTVHWTHRDLDGGHVAGWVKFKGKTYQ
jgi:hypothetical protein